VSGALLLPAGPAVGMNLLGSTGLGGFTVQDATPNLFSFVIPNDGNMHRIMALGEMIVSSAQTGGLISVLLNDPSGTPRTRALFNGGYAAGYQAIDGFLTTIAPGQTITVAQTSAQTAGAAVAWIEIWGS
jgi:hypothetical protein